ncbi:MAG: hypothetical protein JHD16_00675 [Solirubrobacteraceae bacterium]|nr:hypothetical protein [Solirubrobacteraceae bacterium]
MSVIDFPDHESNVKLRKKQAAIVLGRSTRWIEMRTNDAGLPSNVGPGGRRFYWRAELITWAAEYGLPLPERTPARTRNPVVPEPAKAAALPALDRRDLAKTVDALVAGVDLVSTSVLAMCGYAEQSVGHGRVRATLADLRMELRGAVAGEGLTGPTGPPDAA